MDPFCRQAWMEYGKRFCIYSATGLAVGAACAFVLLGSLFHFHFSFRKAYSPFCMHGTWSWVWPWLCLDTNKCWYPQSPSSKKMEKWWLVKVEFVIFLHLCVCFQKVFFHDHLLLFHYPFDYTTFSINNSNIVFFTKNLSIWKEMSSTILEKTRFLHEDIERYEQAIERELETPARTVHLFVILFYL